MKKFWWLLLGVMIFSLSSTVVMSRNENLGYFLGDIINNIYTGNVTSLPWANITSRPSDCPSGEYVYGIDGASLECREDQPGNTTDEIFSTVDNNTFQYEIGSDCGAGLCIYGVQNDGTLDCRVCGGGTGSTLWQVSGDWMFPNETAGGKTYINVTFINSTYAQFNWIDAVEIAEPSSPPVGNLRLFVVDESGFSVLKYKDELGVSRSFNDDEIIVYNIRGTTIAAHRIVYATGNVGGVTTVDLADSSNISKMPSIGVTIESIANGSYGRVLQVGQIENVDTSSLDLGIIYVSDRTAGIPTNTPPLTPNLTQEIGTVLVKDAALGKIQIIARALTGDEFGTINNFTVASGQYFIGDGSQLTGISTFNTTYHTFINANFTNESAYISCTGIYGSTSNLCTIVDTSNTTAQIRTAMNSTLFFIFTANTSIFWDGISSQSQISITESQISDLQHSNLTETDVEGYVNDTQYYQIRVNYSNVLNHPSMIDTNCSVTNSCPNIQYGSEESNTTEQVQTAVNVSEYYILISNETMFIECSGIYGNSSNLCTITDTDTSNTTTEVRVAVNSSLLYIFIANSSLYWDNIQSQSEISITESQISDLSHSNLTESEVETYINNSYGYFEILVNETRYVDCNTIYGGSDGDFCTDASGGGGGTGYWQVGDGWMFPNTTAGGDNDINVTNIRVTDEVQLDSANITDTGSNSSIYFNNGNVVVHLED